jgi:hypothetical protein
LDKLFDERALLGTGVTGREMFRFVPLHSMLCSVVICS